MYFESSIPFFFLHIIHHDSHDSWRQSPSWVNLFDFCLAADLARYVRPLTSTPSFTSILITESTGNPCAADYTNQTAINGQLRFAERVAGQMALNTTIRQFILETWSAVILPSANRHQYHHHHLLPISHTGDPPGELGPCMDGLGYYGPDRNLFLSMFCCILLKSMH